jgi:pseudaminic acid synthase
MPTVPSTRPNAANEGSCVPAGPRTVIVAELSANHGRDLERTLDTVRAMREAGADMVKLQTYRPESLTLDLHDSGFGPLKTGPWAGVRPYDLFIEGALPYDWHERIFELARSMGIGCFSAPFDLEAVGFLESLDNPIYKVASLEINHIPLLECIAATGKPVVLSTGAAKLGDIELALDTLGRNRTDITLLKCTTAYPTPYGEVNLRAMVTLGTTFGVPVGLSDHTPGYVVPVAAVALGASMIEKHFILDRAHGGIDAHFSMEPHEFRAMVEAVRSAEEALGAGTYALSPASTSAHERMRSIFVAETILAGQAFTEANLRVVRPASGLHPRHWREVLNSVAARDLAPGTPLVWSAVEAPSEAS